MSYQSEAVNAQVEGVNAPTAVQRSNAGAKAPGQTLKTFTGQSLLTASTGTIALYTVTTGKSFYITDVMLTSDVASSLNLDVRIQADGVDMLRTSVHSLAPIDFSGIESQPVAASGAVVNILTASAATTSHLWYSVYGWEE